MAEKITALACFPQYILSDIHHVSCSHGDQQIVSFYLGEKEVFDLTEGREVIDVGAGFF